MYSTVKRGHGLKLEELVSIVNLPFIHLNFMTFLLLSKSNAGFIALLWDHLYMLYNKYKLYYTYIIQYMYIVLSFIKCR